MADLKECLNELIQEKEDLVAENRNRLQQVLRYLVLPLVS